MPGALGAPAGTAVTGNDRFKTLGLKATGDDTGFTGYGMVMGAIGRTGTGALGPATTLFRDSKPTGPKFGEVS